MSDIGNILLQALGIKTAKDLHPYDPAQNHPVDIGYGDPSTEYTMSAQDPYGMVISYPSIWWANHNQPVQLSPDEAYQRALAYEQATGKLFPRYNNYDEEGAAATLRSKAGGAEKTPLTGVAGTIDPDTIRWLLGRK